MDAGGKGQEQDEKDKKEDAAGQEGTQGTNQGDTQVVTKKKRRIAIDYIIDKNYDNAYIQSWLALPFVPVIREDANFHSFLNHNELKKEITESFAVFVRVQQIIKRLYTLTCTINPPSGDLSHTSTSSSTPSATTSTTTSTSATPLSSPSPSMPQYTKSIEEFTENIVLFDVCSGKGYAATLLSFMFPKLKIFMIDKDTKMNLKHLQALPNVKMIYFDLFKKEKVQEWVGRQIQNKIGLFLGTHLCGELSEMFVDIYNAVPELKGLVLAPCCLSKRKRIFADTAAKLKIDNYEYWTMHLYWMIQLSKKNICADENVFSVKNNYISAVKCYSTKN